MVSPLELIVIVLSTLAVVGFIALLRHRKYGTLMFNLLMTLSLAVAGGVFYYQLAQVPQGQAYEATPAEPFAAVPETNSDERTLLQKAVSRVAEVASDAELAAIAAAEPKIDLDADRRAALEAAQKDWDAERIRANDEAYGRDAEAKRIQYLEEAWREAGGEKDPEKRAKDAEKERPAWVHGDVAENQTVFTSGPFTTAESCREDARRQLLFWLPFMKGEPPSEEGADGLRALMSSQPIDDFIKAQHAETRETSVGEMHLLYTLAEMNPEIESKIEKAIQDYRLRETQAGRLGAVTALGAGVVSLVALAHLVLRAGGGTSKPM